MYNANTASSISGIAPHFKLVNNGSSAIDLSGITLRYYFTNDGTQKNNFWCDYSSIGNDNVTGSFTSMSTTASGADTYLQLGFSSGAGTLAAGASADIQARFSKDDWSNYNQSDDYSFNSSASSYVDWSKVTAYQNGKLIWGSEPQ